MPTFLCWLLLATTVGGTGSGPETACAGEDAAAEEGRGSCVAIPAQTERLSVLLQKSNEVSRTASEADIDADAKTEADTEVDAELARLLFETEEHQSTGNSISTGDYKGSDDLPLSSGFKLTYGDILSLAGDYYGLNDKAISDVCDKSEQEKLFLKSFGCLEQDGANGNDPARIFEFAHLATKTGYAKSQWETLNVPDGCGAALTLAKINFDHFPRLAGHSCEDAGGAGNVDAYSAGHRVACRKATEPDSEGAGGPNNPTNLQRALAYNAFASHFLSDMFAGGHMRTPRRFVPDICSKWQHDEDNQVGVNVQNANGDKWRAYGDGCHADERNKKNREIELKTLTKSVEAVLNAHETKDAAQCIEDADVLSLIPDIELLQDPTRQQEQGNAPPMFVPVNDAGVLNGPGKLKSGPSAFMRADICSLSDFTFKEQEGIDSSPLNTKPPGCEYPSDRKGADTFKDEICVPVVLPATQRPLMTKRCNTGTNCPGVITDKDFDALVKSGKASTDDRTKFSGRCSDADKEASRCSSVKAHCSAGQVCQCGWHNGCIDVPTIQ